MIASVGWQVLRVVSDTWNVVGILILTETVRGVVRARNPGHGK